MYSPKKESTAVPVLAAFLILSSHGPDPPIQLPENCLPFRKMWRAFPAASPFC